MFGLKQGFLVRFQIPDFAFEIEISKELSDQIYNGSISLLREVIKYILSFGRYQLHSRLVEVTLMTYFITKHPMMN